MMGDVRVSLPAVSVELWDNRGKALAAFGPRTTSLVVVVHYIFKISGILTGWGTRVAKNV